MSKGKNSQGRGKKELSLVRSSAAEYLTFVAAGGLFDRADHRKENMGLTRWEGAPHGKSHRYDVAIAKNDLSEFELAQMQRIAEASRDL